MFDRPKTLSRPQFVATWVFLLAWLVVLDTGMDLPYLRTAFAWNVRFYVMCPLLIAMLVYLCFIRDQNGRTGIQWALSKLPGRWQRLHLILVAVAGLFIVAGGLSWSSIAYPAWITRLCAEQSFVKSYEITSMTSYPNTFRGRTYVLSLVDEKAAEVVELPLSDALVDDQTFTGKKWLCARGRTSMFGTIIESIIWRACDQG